MNEFVVDNLDRILKIGVLLTAQRKMSKLLEVIVTEAMEIAHCDAGTLYMLEDDNMLHFKIMRNHTMKTYSGGENEEISLPPFVISEANVAAYVVIHRKMENIEDVYHSSKFDFSGPKNYDKMTGYVTKSMLVVPLENNRGEVVGVLQLLNATNKEGKVVPFDEEMESIILSIASQAAIAVTNMNYTKENKELFKSLVEVLATAIDERSPYNANHTKNVARLAENFMDFVNELNKNGISDIHFEDDLKEQITMAAWLHDVGKIITPLEIMDKSTRLGVPSKLAFVKFDTIMALENLRFLSGDYTEEGWKQVQAEIADVRKLCEHSNSGAPISQEESDRIKSIAMRKTLMPSGEELYWLTESEAESLSLRYGTLTPRERKIMEEHVVITKRLLDKMKFSKEYSNVPMIARTHHEKLNGKGYPLGLDASMLPIGSRVLAVMDVFEALTATDRPYKKPMSIAKAFEILDKMVGDGEIDGKIVSYLKMWKLDEK